MNVRKYFFPSNKLPKYDIYEHSLDDDDQKLPDSPNIFDRERFTIGNKSVSQSKGKKWPFHSTPLDANFQPHKVPVPSLASISGPSQSSSNLGVSLSGSSFSFETPRKRISKSSRQQLDSSLFSRANITKTPKAKPGSSRFSKSSTPARRTSSLTPGSTTSASDVLSPSTIVAIVEGRGQARMEVGIAAIDLNRPLLTMVQFSDTHTYIRTLTKLTILNPVEVLFANTAEEERLIKVVRESLDRVTITSVHRKYFNESRGLAIVKHLATRQCSHISRQISSKYYCLSAVAALIRYVEQIQNVTYAPHTLMIAIASSELVLTIDHCSSKNLELVRNLSKGWKDSLFGAIRHTSTPSGTRMLRASLLQPFADLRIIETRLSALEYLTQHQDLFYSLKSILGRFPDLDWILSMCVQRHKEDSEVRIEQRLNYVIGLKDTLELLHPLKLALETIENQFFVFIRESIANEETEVLLNLLREVLHEDVRLVKGCTAMRAQRCYAIKSNINSLLDVARKIYSEIVDDIIGQVEGLAANYEISMKVGHSSKRGFHIIIPLAKGSSRPSLPQCFLQVQKNRTCITCTTEEIFQLDQRSRECVREILIMSNVIILELMSEIRERVGALYGVAEALAILDMVVGLTHVASLGSWVRPEFSTHLAIREGRHPILDILSTTPLIPNNTFLNEEKRVMVISGPNMSGKSTYLKQVALIQVLAQIGSYVPAKLATLKLVDHIFTLLGREDIPENNESTFQVQMNEVSTALQLAGSRSLVLLDELGQGTNINEGSCLAWAIMEGFIFSKAQLALATHLTTLTRLADLYPQVTNFYMESSLREDKKLHLSYILRKGVNEAKNYGLSLATSTPLPKPLLQRAYQLSTEMETTNKGKPTPSEEECRAGDVVYLLAHQLLAFTASLPMHYFSHHSSNSTVSDAEDDLSHSKDEEEHLKTILKEMLKQFVVHQKQVMDNPAS